MTTIYNRSEILTWDELTDENQSLVLSDYCYELEQAEEDRYVILDGDAIPLGMFMRTTNNKFTHGIYSTSAFDGYFITLAKSNDCAVVAHKYF